MSVPGTVRSGGEITFWDSLGQKHIMLFIVSQEPVHLLILKKIPACWNCVVFFFLLQITAKVKKKKSATEHPNSKGVEFTCRLMLVQLKSCSPSAKFASRLLCSFSCSFMHCDLFMRQLCQELETEWYPYLPLVKIFKLYFFLTGICLNLQRYFWRKYFQYGLPCSPNLSLFKQIHLDGKESDHNFGAVCIEYILSLASTVPFPQWNQSILIWCQRQATVSCVHPA